MTIGFFLFEGFWVGEMRHFGGRRKKQMKWQGEKMNRLKPNIRRSTGLDEMPVPQKTLKSAFLHPTPSPTSCTHTCTHNHARFPGFELRRMLSVTFQKCERRRGTVHLSETLVFSLYGETYPAEHITISACDNIGNSMYPLYLSVWVSHGHKDGDNVAKWCLRVADLKPSAATYSLTTTLSITSQL